MDWLFPIVVIAAGIAAVIISAGVARSRRPPAPEVDRRVDRFVERQQGPRVVQPGQPPIGHLPIDAGGDGGGGGGDGGGGGAD
jgi:hypothetical protein